MCLAYTALVIYGSLVPFQFRPIPLDQALERFLQIPYLQLGIGLHSAPNVLHQLRLEWFETCKFPRSQVVQR